MGNNVTGIPFACARCPVAPMRVRAPIVLPWHNHHITHTHTDNNVNGIQRRGYTILCVAQPKFDVISNLIRVKVRKSFVRSLVLFPVNVLTANKYTSSPSPLPLSRIHFMSSSVYVQHTCFEYDRNCWCRKSKFGKVYRTTPSALCFCSLRPSDVQERKHTQRME